MQSFKRCSRFVIAIGALGLAAAGSSFLFVQRPADAKPLMKPETPVCVFGWSKDHCEGKLNGDSIIGYGCQRFIDGTLFECKTIEVHDASLKFTVQGSSASCGNTADVLCDETKHLDGTIVIKGDFIFRYNDPCRFRGCWRGEWTLVTDDGSVVASGKGHGTLGTGSHRSPTCTSNDQICSPDCEKCYEVQFVPNSDPPFEGTWYVDLEGCLEGEVFAGPFESSEVCVTISGTLATKGTVWEPYSFGKWQFCGASDGTVLAKCEM